MESEDTQKNTRWSITVFEEWRKNHNSCSVEHFIPIYLVLLIIHFVFRVNTVLS